MTRMPDSQAGVAVEEGADASTPGGVSRRGLVGALVASTLGGPLIQVRASVREPILVGQTADFSGTRAATVAELNQGAALVIQSVNAQGGIGGRPIGIIREDDVFDARKAAANVGRLAQRGACCLFMSRGTPAAMGMIPALKSTGMPLIAPSTGAMSIREPLVREIFPVRGAYRVEAARLIEFLHGVSARNIAVVAIDDGFGKDVITGIDAMPADVRRTLKIHRFAPALQDMNPMAEQVLREGPSAVVVVASVAHTSGLMKAIHQRDRGVVMGTLSNNASQDFIDKLGTAGPGVQITQVLPNPGNRFLPLTIKANALYADSLRRASKPGRRPQLSPMQLEGYLGALVLVEALQRARGDYRFEAIRQGLESAPVNTGWRSLNFSANRHDAIDFVELSAISPAGTYRY